MPKTKPELRTIPIEKLKRGRYQPRRDFNAQALQELADSIISSGLIQPIIVRPIADHYFEIVAGERRWRAAQLIPLKTVDCLIKDYTDAQTAAVATIENINRIDLNPIEEAEAYRQLISEFNYLHEEVAAIVGKSRTKITNSLRLLKLDSRIQALLKDKILSEGHGKVLATLPLLKQIELAELCVSKHWNVRRLEQAIKNLEEQKLPTNSQLDPNIESLERTLSEHIGCKVQIEFLGHNGQLKINFHNLDILEGLLQKIGYKL